MQSRLAGGPLLVEGNGMVRWKLAIVLLLLIAASAATVWFWTLFWRIDRAAVGQPLQPADAIAVFGAAEYRGRPSPVLNARLERALDLYKRGYAPIIITLGGGGDPQYSEGGVGRNFLLAHGVPDDRIIAETQSSDTEESIQRLAAIARENHLRTILAVSDGTHLFRIAALARAAGLNVRVTPRETGRSVSGGDILLRYVHEMASYTLWRMHLH
jgi:uncharacterized SAM-binding protein YcdF (DUF218 family)